MSWSIAQAFILPQIPMKKIELILIAAVLIGGYLDMNLIPAGKWILMIAIGLLANTYLFDLVSIVNNTSLAEYAKRDRASRKLNLKQMLPGYALVSLIMGMLFNFETWPGGNTIILIGWGLGIVSIYLLYNKLASDRKFSRDVISRILIMGVVALFFYLLPPYYWFDKIYTNYPEYIQARKNFDKDPKSDSLKIIMEQSYQSVKK